MGLDLSLPESARLLQGTARAYFERSYSLARAQNAERAEAGMDTKLWADIASMGWLSLASDDDGDSRFLDMCALLEEFGRARAVVPFKESAVGVGYLVSRQDTAGARDLLRGIVSGHIYTCAAAYQLDGLLTGDVVSPVQAEKAGPALKLSGTLRFVPFAALSAGMVVVVQGPFGDGLALVLLHARVPGISMRRIRTVSPTPQYEVVLPEVKVEEPSVVAQGASAIKRWAHLLGVAASAEALGACSAVLDMSVRYAKGRVQFGQPIGSFQAIQNRLADMVIDLDVTRYLLYDAAWRLASGEPADRQIAFLGAWAGPTFERICVQGHHINGAMSVTEEYGLEFYSRIVLGTRLVLGEPGRAKDEALAYIEADVKEG